MRRLLVLPGLCLALMASLALAQPSLRPALPLQARPGGNIIFTRMLAVPVQGVNQPIPLPKLFVMGGDGSNPRPFFTPGEFQSAAQARWSPDYDQLVFASDLREASSACVFDVFAASADGTRFNRVTGSEPPFVVAYGAVRGTIRNNIEGRQVPVQHTEINIAAAGADIVYHPNPDLSFEIPLMAASESAWIRVWTMKSEGNLVTRTILPNQVNDVGAIPLSGANLYASKPSITRDGRYVVGMGGMIATRRDAQGPQLGEHDAPPLQLVKGGSEDLAVFDCAQGGMIVAMHQSLPNMANKAKDPATSPDGRFVALAYGQETLEGLGITTVEAIISGQPNPRMIVPGERLYPSALTGFQAGHLSVGTPAWRHDGGLIAFGRGALMTQVVTGEIWVVAPDGSGLRQVTNFGVNHICGQPCFSPDGTRIAFTVLTGKLGPIAPEQLVMAQFNTDIYTINVDGSGLQRLTNDGASAEPAWGP